jgi:hypothetical protein
MAVLTATRSSPLRRSCRAASRGRAATTPAKDPPILSPITTPIATDGDPGAAHNNTSTMVWFGGGSGGGCVAVTGERRTGAGRRARGEV